MPFITYQLPDGSFATTDAGAPAAYTAMWSITAEQAAKIEAGGDIHIENGDLIVIDAAIALDVDPGVEE